MITSSKKYIPKAIALSAFVIISLSLAGCLDDDIPVPEPAAYATLYHGSPDAGSVDIYLDDKKANSSAFLYKAYTGYVGLDPGDRTFGFKTFSEGSEIAEKTASFEEGKYYSIFLAGELEDAEVVVLKDTASNPVSGKAHVRIINLSPDAGPVTLFINEAVTTNLEFKDATAFKYVTSGLSDVKILDSGNDAVLAKIDAATLVAGAYYTLIVSGYRTPPSGNQNELAVQLVIN